MSSLGFARPMRRVRRSVRSSVLAALCGAAVVGPIAWSAAASSAQAVIDVSNVSQLQSAVNNLVSGATIRIAPGRYAITQELRIRNGVRNVALVGATGNRNDVVIVGSGMKRQGVNIVIKVENAQDVRIADLSVGDAFWHPIQLQGELGADRVRISNVRLFDAGQQFLKSTVNPQAPNGTDDVIVEGSLVEYTTIGPDHGYTQGIDVHHGANWIIRGNVFRNIRVPPGAGYTRRPAISMWSGSRNTTVHNNLFINCERAIVFGLDPQPQYQHAHFGGVIYNNIIYRTDPVNADAGISVWDSPGTRVYHNTIVQNGTYPTAIEYRFAGTTGVDIANNLTDGVIQRRDGASGTVTNNYTQAAAGLFVNPAAFDFHLVSSAVVAIDQGKAIAAVVDDWDGERRPAGLAPDLGADERGGTSTPPPTPTPGSAPVASFTVSASSGPAPLTVNFDGRASRDPDGGALTMQWEFGDGQTATGATVAHTYTTPGTFVARLTVTDPAKLSASVTRSIVVAGGDPLAGPTGLTASLSTRVVTLTWADNATAETGYFLERAVMGRNDYRTIAHLGADTKTYVDRNLTPGAYLYRLRAYSASLNRYSVYSTPVLVTVR